MPAALIENPEYSEWQRIFAANRAGLQEQPEYDKRRTLRSAMLAAAEEYDREVDRIAKEAGLSFKRDVSRKDDSIVMSGHQPEIFHSGLFHKVRRLSDCVRDFPATGIQIIIDTDEGEAGRIIFPRKDNFGLRYEIVSLSSSEGLYLRQKLADRNVIVEAWRKIIEGLESSGSEFSSTSANRARDIYTSLGGVSVSAANSIVRSHFEDRKYLELPLSRLFSLPAVAEELDKIISHPLNLVSSYNSTLDSYRKEHKIENPANPFPNLDVTDGKVELPVWAIDQSLETRQKVYIEFEENSFSVVIANQVEWKGDLSGLQSGWAAIRSKFLFVPRGALITLFLRYLFSDLFIHGLGGARYDKFTDLLAKNYLKRTLPLSVSASVNRYLFTNELKAYETAVSLKDSYKEIVSKTDSFLGKGLFGESYEKELKDLSGERAQLIQKLSLSGLEGIEKRAISLRLNELNKRIREVIDSSDYPSRIVLAAAPTGEANTWRNREFPFFFFGS